MKEDRSYERFDKDLTNVLLCQGSGVKEMLAKSKVGALEHNLSISHLDLRHEAAASISKACKRTEKYCREMYSHTSTNGIFLLILAGAQGNNAAVGVKLNTLPDR